MWNQREVRTLRVILALFLDVSIKTILDNIKGISASSASRFLSTEHAPNEVFWEELNSWQLAQLYRPCRRGRRGDTILKLDLTCIEKRGQKIPFARVFNKHYGIQLVVLHVCMAGRSFPLGYRIYEGKGQQTVVALALELLAAFPASLWSSSVVVMADAGFGSNHFITEAQALGFKRLLVGLRCDRKLSDGRRLDALKQRGQCLRLQDLPLDIYISWCEVKRDEGKKRFFLLSTFQASGAYLARRYRKRWLIESFFKSLKYDFGLKEARLRSKGGIRLWIFFACLAYSLASLERSFAKQTLSLQESAERVLDGFVDIRLLHLLIDCERFNLRHKLHLRLVAV